MFLFLYFLHLSLLTGYFQRLQLDFSKTWHHASSYAVLELINFELDIDHSPELVLDFHHILNLLHDTLNTY